jgi:hypothetical protein
MADEGGHAAATVEVREGFEHGRVLGLGDAGFRWGFKPRSSRSFSIPSRRPICTVIWKMQLQLMPHIERITIQ